MKEAVGRARFIQRLVEWESGERLPIDVRTDCMSLQTHLTKCWSVEDKETALAIEPIKDHLKQGEIRSVKHIARQYNYADQLTRNCYSAVGNRFRAMMSTGMIDGIY